MKLYYGLAALLLLATSQLPAAPLDLQFPTENHALIEGKPEDFYQYIERNFRNEITYPWEGGQYGYVRDPVETPAGVVFRRFHEGLDIKPLHRDARGIPTDEVHPIAPGTVVYVSNLAGASNYGRYVVVRHVWDGSPYYSLYAHLASTKAIPGEAVQHESVLGVLGSTGDGLDNARAHLHLELNLMLGDSFESWHTANFPGDPNKHGLFNGLNLAGIDIAHFYLALQKNPKLTIPEFLASEKVSYRVRVPLDRSIPMLRDYPWLLKGSIPNCGGWEIAFANSGLPLQIQPVPKPVAAPELVWNEAYPARAEYATKRVLTGTASNASLSKIGLRYLELIAEPPGR